VLTTTSITSHSQGQIYGKKPNLEEFERQLEADPMTKYAARLVQVFVQLASGLRTVRLPASELGRELIIGHR
jgi:hypothetical protein